MSARDRIEAAFDRLAAKPGFVERSDQRQLALLISDLVAGGAHGAIEAPTGLGKSLAALIPAIAHALEHGTRTVIATYTNVLAEQYWRRDLPFALTLFDDPIPAAFLIGRQRYLCLAALQEQPRHLREGLADDLRIGIETEFREVARMPARELGKFWSQVAVPPVCPGRLCPQFDRCFYYNARREAEKALVVITNHSVVLQDALVSEASEDGKGLLGDMDALILDEAHDFAQAAGNGLEFELSQSRIATLAALSTKLETAIAPIAARNGEMMLWAQRCTLFREQMDLAKARLASFVPTYQQSGILSASPAEVLDHPQVMQHRLRERSDEAREIADTVSRECSAFEADVSARLTSWSGDAESKLVRDATRNYISYFREVGTLADAIFSPQGVEVSHASAGLQGTILRRDVIGLSEPLDNLIWSKVPTVCLSATLAIDGSFDYFKRTTGFAPAFEEILPSPFDFGRQAALYLPKAMQIPDPSLARKEGSEDRYHAAIAAEVKKIIETVGGRTLALFHSRREMEAVRNLIEPDPGLPIYLQLRSGAGAVGERFIRDTRSSLFALRSFWTGFDAPGETLSCVILVRVPFEVPIDPPQIARLAWMQTQGLDAFREHTLPGAKMMIRQGAGRLIRRSEDRGLICLLDPRLRTKRYGEEILANLPAEMRTFDDVVDAAGWIGL